MASNPMQRQARNSFLLGMIVTMIIAFIIVALLFMQIKKLNTEISNITAAKVRVYVLNQDVKSGQIITPDMFTQKEVDKSGVPENSTNDIVTTLSSYSLRDTSNHLIGIKPDENNKSYYYYIKIDDTDYKIYINDATGKEVVATELKVGEKAYYYEKNDPKEGKKNDIDITNNSVIAQIEMKANTIITGNMIRRSNEINTDDIRQQEYNMLSLPIDLMTGDYIDVRLLLPTGQDYIVISKKMATIPMVNGAYLSDTIQMNLAEEEVLTMSSAIVEAYKIEGSKLYVTKYTEAGTQEAAVATYIANAEVVALMNKDPNIVNEAKAELVNRYANATDLRNNSINGALSTYGDDDAVKEKIKESITSTKESRQQYLQSLPGTAAGAGDAASGTTATQ